MAKTFTFDMVHLLVAFVVAYLLTGSGVLGGIVALIVPMANTLANYFHEKAGSWWRNRPAGVRNRQPATL